MRSRNNVTNNNNNNAYYPNHPYIVSSTEQQQHLKIINQTRPRKQLQSSSRQQLWCLPQTSCTSGTTASITAVISILLLFLCGGCCWLCFTLTTTNQDNDKTPLPNVRIWAFVFPQFHRDEINDRLWGDNFTDWDSLRAAPRQNRLGDWIPRPTELGYYDYTQLEPRKRQGELAKQYLLDGFLFHHYWFYDTDHPGPNLNAPLEALLLDGEPDVPFALHWCASKWVTTWNGKVRSDFHFQEPGVLQKQYFPTDHDDPLITVHYQWLRRFFHHRNYIKVHGKPLFMLYVRKPGSFLVLKRLQQLAKEDGFPGLYLTVGLTKNHPHLLPISNASRYKTKPMKINAPTMENFHRVLAYPNPTEWNVNRTMTVPVECGKQPRVMEIPAIISSFDNTPRRNITDATIWSRPTTAVEYFRTSLSAALYYETCCFPPKNNTRSNNDDDERIIVINAMNEWAEGMALEPSDVYGRRFLETIRDVKMEQLQNQCRVLPKRNIPTES